ncbi:MAG: tetratricopeptide repeat protein [Sandaracinaceae bacterium]
MTPSRATLALFAGLVAMLPYAATPTFGPTYDDHHHVSRHPLLETPENGLRDLVTGDYLAVEQPDRARPVHLLSLLLDRLVLEPQLGSRYAAHHLGSVLVHGATTALLFLLLVALGARAGPSWFGAALFGVHPAAVEAVAGVSNREDPLAALFTLVFLLATLRYWRDGRRGMLGLGLVGLLLALGSKESAIVAPLLLLALTHLFEDRFGPSRRNRLFSLGAGVAACFAIFGALQWRLGAPGLALFSGGAPLAPQLSIPFRTDWMTAVPIEAFRLVRVVLGAPLSAEHDPRPWAHPGWVGLGAVVLLLLLGLAVQLHRRHRRSLAPLAWIAIGTLPVVPSPWLLNPIADRYLYLPALGLGLLGACAATSRNRWVPLSLALAITVGAVSTAAHAAIWRDDVRLFEHAAARAPDASRVHLNLGAAHLRRGELAAAAPALQRAAALEPESVAANYTLGQLWERRGDLSRATESMERAATAPTSVGESGLHDRAFFAWARLLHQRGDRNRLRRAVQQERIQRPDSRPAAVWWARLSQAEREQR